MRKILAVLVVVLLCWTVAPAAVHVHENYLTTDSNNFTKIPASAPLIEIFNTATKATAAGTASTSVSVQSCTGYQVDDQVYVGTNDAVTISACSGTTMTLNTALTWAAWDSVILKRDDSADPNNDDRATIYRESGLSTSITQPFSSDSNGQWEFWIADGTYGLRVSDSGDSTLAARVVRYYGTTGPASSTDNAVVRWNGTGGDTTQDSSVTMADTTGTMTFTGDASLVFEGATDDTNETTISITDPTGDNTITVPDATITIAGDSTSVTDLDSTGLTISSNALSVATTEINDTTWGDNSEAILTHTFDPTGSNNPVMDWVATGVNIYRGSGADISIGIGQGNSQGTIQLSTGTDTDTHLITTESTTTGKTAALPDVSGMVMLQPNNSTEGILIWADVDTRTTANAACSALGLTCSAGGLDPVDGTEFGCAGDPTTACSGSCTTASGYFFATCN